MNQAEVQGLLKTAAATIRELTEDRDTLAGQLAENEKRDRAGKIASRLVERGLLASDDQLQKVAELMEGQDLEVVEKALDLTSAPDGVAKLATVGAQPSGGGLSAFEQYVMSYGSPATDAGDFQRV